MGLCAALHLASLLAWVAVCNCAIPCWVDAHLWGCCSNRDYYKCWIGLKSHFDPTRAPPPQQHGADIAKEQQQNQISNGVTPEPAEA